MRRWLSIRRQTEPLEPFKELELIHLTSHSRWKPVDIEWRQEKCLQNNTITLSYPRRKMKEFGDRDVYYYTYILELVELGQLVSRRRPEVTRSEAATWFPQRQQHPYCHHRHHGWRVSITLLLINSPQYQVTLLSPSTHTNMAYTQT